MARKKTPEPTPYRPWEDPELVVRPQTISPQVGFTREERRHGFRFLPNPGGSEMIAEINKAAFDLAKRAGRNTPWVGPVFAERAEKLRGRRKARHVLGPVPVPDVADAAISEAIEKHWAREAALRVFGKRSTDG